MNYYFVSFADNATAVIVAENLESAAKIAARNKKAVKDLYLLQGDTFTAEGYLVEQK